MKTYWVLSYALLGFSFSDWLENVPAEKWHGIIYYPAIVLSGIFVLFVVILKLLEKHPPPTKPVG